MDNRFLIILSHLTDESTETQSSDKLPKVTGLVSTRAEI